MGGLDRAAHGLAIHLSAHQGCEWRLALGHMVHYLGRLVSSPTRATHAHRTLIKQHVGARCGGHVWYAYTPVSCRIGRTQSRKPAGRNVQPHVLVAAAWVDTFLDQHLDWDQIDSLSSRQRAARLMPDKIHLCRDIAPYECGTAIPMRIELIDPPLRGAGTSAKRLCMQAAQDGRTVASDKLGRTLGVHAGVKPRQSSMEEVQAGWNQHPAIGLPPRMATQGEQCVGRLLRGCAGASRKKCLAERVQPDGVARDSGDEALKRPEVRQGVE